MKLIHLTDTHLTRPGQLLYGTSPAERLRACVDSINREHADADLCVITGDLAHSGETQAYEELETILAELQVPVQLVIGNHDHRERLLQRFPDLQRDERGFVQSVRRCQVGTLIFMDSVRDGSHAGAYCSQRQRWLAAQLEQAEGDVFLFLHHAPFKTGIKPMDLIGLDEDHARALKSLLQAQGACATCFLATTIDPCTATGPASAFPPCRGSTTRSRWI